MTVRYGWLSPDGQSRADTRHTALGATTPAGPLRSRSGILPGTDDGQYRIGGLGMAGTTGTMTAVVHPGRAVVQGAGSRGAYPVALDEDVTVSFAPGDAQYGRVDLVVLRVYDDEADGSGRSEAAVETVQGTPAAVPSAPAAPGLALPLFQVAVPAGTSAGTGGIPGPPPSPTCGPRWSRWAASSRSTTTVRWRGVTEVSTRTTRAKARFSGGAARPGCRIRRPSAGSPRRACSPPAATPASTATPRPVNSSAGTAVPGNWPRRGRRSRSRWTPARPRRRRTRRRSRTPP
ncbi:hypothetical protein N7U49_19645 [Streptomyces sp. AD2-2]|nr:hypothetical protein N7U49_19645 [Streptomyces sp. AD2-2]